MQTSCHIYTQVTSFLLEMTWQIFQLHVAPSVARRRRRSVNEDEVRRAVDTLLTAILDSSEPAAADTTSTLARDQQLLSQQQPDNTTRTWREVTSRQRRRRRRSTGDEACEAHVLTEVQQLSEILLALVESDEHYDMHPEITVSNCHEQMFAVKFTCTYVGLRIFIDSGKQYM